MSKSCAFVCSNPAQDEYLGSDVKIKRKECADDICDYVERIGLMREETVNLQEQLERMCLTGQEEKERVQEAWTAEGLTRELVDRYIERADVDREGKIELVWKDGRQV